MLEDLAACAESELQLRGETASESKLLKANRDLTWPGWWSRSPGAARLSSTCWAAKLERSRQHQRPLSLILLKVPTTWRQSTDTSRGPPSAASRSQP